MTHLACRSARYTRLRVTVRASPATHRRPRFRLRRVERLPSVAGCTKQDYAVLIVIAWAWKIECRNDGQRGWRTVTKCEVILKVDDR